MRNDYESRLILQHPAHRHHYGFQRQQKDEPELQWLEDGVNLLIRQTAMLVIGICAAIWTGVVFIVQAIKKSRT